MWKKFYSKEGDKNIEQIKSIAGVWLEDDKAKIEAFDYFYTERGHKVPWPKNLTPTEMHLTARFELLFQAKDLWRKESGW